MATAIDNLPIEYVLAGGPVRVIDMSSPEGVAGLVVRSVRTEAVRRHFDRAKT